MSDLNFTLIYTCGRSWKHLTSISYWYYTFSPVICFRQLPFCLEDFPLNDVTFYLDLSFDRAFDFPIYLMKFVDKNGQIEGKLLVIIKHNAIYLFSSITNFLMHLIAKKSNHVFLFSSDAFASFLLKL